MGGSLLKGKADVDVIANGVRLQYSESGSGFPVVCMHGNGLNRDMWRHLIPELNQRYRAIAYDQRAMGKSETPGRPGLTFLNEVHAKDYQAFLDALDIDQAAIVAQAFGGFAALRTAIDRPERVKAMVLVNISAKMGGRTMTTLPEWPGTVEEHGMEPLLDEAMDRWFVQRVHREHPEVVQFYREMLGANPPMGYAANTRGIMKYDISDELGKIRCPTLVITGKEDWSTPAGDQEILAQGIPGAQLAVVPDASHTVPEENAGEFNRLTLEFLGQHIPTSLS